LTSINKTKLWIIGYFFIFFLFLFIFPSVAFSLVFAVMVSMIINYPIKIFFKEKTDKQKTKIRVIFALIIWGVLVLLIALAIPIIINSVQTIQTEILKFFSEDRKVDLNSKLLSDSINSILNFLKENLSDFLINFVSIFSSNITKWVTSAVIIVIAASYIAQKTDSLKKYIWMVFPGCDQKKTYLFLHSLKNDLESFIGGQIMIAIFIGLMVGVGAGLIGLNEALFLGLLAGVTNFIPYLGVVITAIPMVLLSYIRHGWWGIIFAIIVLLIANQLEIWFLSPKIISKQVKLNWFIILISILAFGDFLGVFGVLFAVPIILVVRRFWKDFLLREEDKINLEKII